MKKKLLSVLLVLAILLVGAGAVALIYRTFKLDTDAIRAELNATPTPTAAAEPTPTPEPTPEPTPAHEWPDVDISSWEFLLANPDHNIGEYVPTLATLEGQQLDERIIEPMKEFVAAARAEGLSVFLWLSGLCHPELSLSEKSGAVRCRGCQNHCGNSRHQRASDRFGLRHYRPLL